MQSVWKVDAVAQMTGFRLELQLAQRLKHAFLLSRIQELHADEGRHQIQFPVEEKGQWNNIRAEMSQLKSRARLALSQNMAEEPEANVSPEGAVSSTIEVQ